jgi:hypothetical protein
VIRELTYAQLKNLLVTTSSLSSTSSSAITSTFIPAATTTAATTTTTTTTTTKVSSRTSRPVVRTIKSMIKALKRVANFQGSCSSFYYCYI